MTQQEEYDLLELGFTEEEIKEIKSAEKSAKKDIKAEN
jgi:hypothetical protein